MRIVIDTNVLISEVFFGGYPGRILSAAVRRQITACATAEIINEYEETVQEMISRRQGRLNGTILTPLINSMEMIDPVTQVKLCRDPDDDKFLGCAKDSHALYIVSGDKDLLVLSNFEGIRIITAKEFSEQYLT